MKTHFSANRLLLLAGALTLLTALPACQQDPNSAGMPAVQLPLSNPHGGTTADAHPAFTFMASTTSHGHTYSTVAVSDSDGTDNTNIYTASASGLDTRFPSWSPNGASVSFVEGPTPTGSGWYGSGDWGAYAVKAIDVSVSGGVASGSNSRTICSYTLADSVKIIVQAWCPFSSVNKIAFIAITPTEEAVYTVSASPGSTPNKIYTVNQSTALLNPGMPRCGGLTWSNDGTKLAFVERGPSSTPLDQLIYEIRIIDLSGAVQQTLDAGNHVIGGLKWSHAGFDTIAFYNSTNMNTSNNAYYDLDVIATTAGSTPRLVKAAASGAFWSPNNSELVSAYYPSGTTGYTAKIVVGTGTVTSLGGIAYGDWKQP